MSGRLEKDYKIYKAIEKTLDNYPRFIIHWYYNLKANKKTATTCNDFMNKVKNFLLFIDENMKRITIDKITPQQLTEYFIKIQYKDGFQETSISYQQGIWSCLNNLFDYLTDVGLIERNLLDVAHIKRPSGNDLVKINKNRKLLTKDDFINIMNGVKSGVGGGKSVHYQKIYRNRDICIMMLFMITGMRRTALEEINVGDINEEEQTLAVTDKGRITHYYKLNDEFMEYYKKWIIDRFFILRGEKVDALFISRDRTRMSGGGIAQLVDKYAYAALGYHISPHKLRSGFASIMYEETGDIEFVRRAIGHSQVTTTQRYIVTKNNEREKAIGIMSGIFNKVEN